MSKYDCSKCDVRDECDFIDDESCPLEDEEPSSSDAIKDLFMLCNTMMFDSIIRGKDQ